MQDVAERACVSVTTVSHVINKTANISAQTSLRVREAALALGYQPRAAAALNCGQRLIAVFIPDISNEFYGQSVQAIFDEAWRHEYAVMVCSMRHHQARTQYIRGLIQNNVRGLIFFGGAPDGEQQILDAAKRVPVVLGDQRLRGAAIDCVGTDNVDAMQRLISRLAHAGYSRIGYVSEEPVLSNSYDRYLGYKLGMEENRLAIESQWVFLWPELCMNKAENAFQRFSSVLSGGAELPQVFVCTSDLIAIGVMGALQSSGRRVPADVGVVGFDNISVAAYTQPPLTTVAQDMKQLGRSCFSALLNRMESSEHRAQDIVVHTKLIVRGSVRL